MTQWIEVRSQKRSGVFWISTDKVVEIQRHYRKNDRPAWFAVTEEETYEIWNCREADPSFLVTVVPANFGDKYYIVGLGDEDEFYKHVFQVIAWAVPNWDIDSPPSPIGVAGMITGEHLTPEQRVIFEHPDGRLDDLYDRTYESWAAVEAHMREELAEAEKRRQQT